MAGAARLAGRDIVPAVDHPVLGAIARNIFGARGISLELLEQQLLLGGRHSPVRLAFSAELVVRESSLRPVTNSV